MKQENKLQEVIDKIHEILPETMKIEKGCRIVAIDGSGDIGEIIYVKEKESVYFTCMNGNNIEYNLTKTFFESRKEGKVKVLGKEPTILNALECLKKLDCQNIKENIEDALSDLTIETWTDGDKYSGIRDLDYCKDTIMENPFIYLMEEADLSKPLLKDQSPELINFLHKVLCKK